MARIAGVNIPENKHTVISLTYIFGIGRTRAASICVATGIEQTAKVRELTGEQLDAIRGEVAKFSTEGDLRREINMNIKIEQEVRVKVEKDLEEYGSVEQRPSMEGRQMTMVIAPNKKK